MRIINRLTNTNLYLKDNINFKTIKDIKKYILKNVSGLYYENIVIIKEGKVLDDNITVTDSLYSYAIIPIKCKSHC